jgi:hypothetical protein
MKRNYNLLAAVLVICLVCSFAFAGCGGNSADRDAEPVDGSSDSAETSVPAEETSGADEAAPADANDKDSVRTFVSSDSFEIEVPAGLNGVKMTEEVIWVYPDDQSWNIYFESERNDRYATPEELLSDAGYTGEKVRSGTNGTINYLYHVLPYYDEHFDPTDRVLEVFYAFVRPGSEDHPVGTMRIWMNDSVVDPKEGDLVPILTSPEVEAILASIRAPQ